MFENKAFYIEMVDKKDTDPSQAANLEDAAIGAAKLVFVTGAALIVVNGLMKILINLTDKFFS